LFAGGSTIPQAAGRVTDASVPVTKYIHYVKRAEFEHQVLTLWMTTRVPLTRANLQFGSGVERRQMERWLDDMVKSGALEFDSDDAGEVLYTVPGAERPKDGVTNLAAVKKLEDLRRSLPKSKALVKSAPSAALATKSDERSLVAAGALSFFLGPLGWLYAAPLKEALPAILIFMVLMKILPAIILGPLLGILLPVSAVAGVSYAWLYNKQGGRTSLVDMSKNKQLPP
jgi:hypothetical protein